MTKTAKRLRPEFLAMLNKARGVKVEEDKAEKTEEKKQLFLVFRPEQDAKLPLQKIPMCCQKKTVWFLENSHQEKSSRYSLRRKML